MVGQCLCMIEATCTVVLPEGMTKGRTLVLFCFPCGFVRRSIWVKALALSKLSLIWLMS